MGICCLGRKVYIPQHSPFTVALTTATTTWVLIGLELTLRKRMPCSGRLCGNLASTPVCPPASDQTLLSHKDKLKDLGCHSSTGISTCLRGIFQALESFLDNDSLLYDHVAGHAGEPWNELCDCLAQQERAKRKG